MKRLILLIVFFSFLISTSFSQNIFKFDIKANHIGYDSKRKLIYATVQENDSTYGNSIIAIDPYDGAITKNVFIGKEPSTFAFTSDSNFIYIAFNNEAVIRKFSLTQFCTVQQIDLEPDSFDGERYAKLLAVIPNNDSVIVVSTRFKNVSPSFAGLLAYSNGKLLPNAIYRNDYINHIDVSIDYLIPTENDTLYAYTENKSPSAFYTIKLNSDSGVVLVSYKNHNYGGLSNLSFDKGFLYSDIGFILNPQNLKFINNFKFPLGYPSFTHCVDPLSNRIFFYTSSGSDLYIIIYDKSTLAKIKEIKIPVDNIFLYQTCMKFIKSGKNGVSLVLKNPSTLNYDDLIFISINDIDNIQSSTSELDANQNLYCDRILTNPVRDNLELDIDAPFQGLYRVKIYDINGRVIKEVQFKYLNKGSKFISINVSTIKEGLYNVFIFKDNMVLSSHKILKI